MTARHWDGFGKKKEEVSQQILTESGNPTPISFALNSFASQEMLTDPNRFVQKLLKLAGKTLGRTKSRAYRGVAIRRAHGLERA